MLRTKHLLFLFVSCVLTACPAFTQNDGRIHLPPLAEQSQGMGHIPVRSQQEIDRERAQKDFEFRQAEIRRNTEKMFQLSSELKDYIDKENAGVLSIDMVKKAEAIEKLAHAVKQMMKDGR